MSNFPTASQQQRHIIEMLEDAKAHRDAHGIEDPALEAQYRRVVVERDFSGLLARPGGGGRTLVPEGQQGYKPELVNRLQDGAMIGERRGRGGAGRYGTRKRTGAAAPQKKEVSERQHSYLRDLVAEIERLDSEAGKGARAWYELSVETDTLTGGWGGTASEMITSFQGTVKELEKRARLAARQAPVREKPARRAGRALPGVANGYYAVKTDKVRFYRVRNHRNGKVYLNRQASDSWHDVAFRDYADILEAIASDPAGAALLYATELGRCSSCNRILTDDVSRGRGKGPDCWAKEN